MKTQSIVPSIETLLAPKARKKKSRDLNLAATLRPAEVFALYGIPSSTLCEMCKHPDPAKRMPSMLIPGRCGRKGVRLIDHQKLRVWLATFDTSRMPVVLEGGNITQAA